MSASNITRLIDFINEADGTILNNGLNFSERHQFHFFNLKSRGFLSSIKNLVGLHREGKGFTNSISSLHVSLLPYAALINETITACRNRDVLSPIDWRLSFLGKNFPEFFSSSVTSMNDPKYTYIFSEKAGSTDNSTNGLMTRIEIIESDNEATQRELEVFHDHGNFLYLQDEEEQKRFLASLPKPRRKTKHPGLPLPCHDERPLPNKDELWATIVNTCGGV